MIHWEEEFKDLVFREMTNQVLALNADILGIFQWKLPRICFITLL